MINNKLHTGFRISALILALAVLLPVGVKLIHSLNHHKHEVCEGYAETHFHSLDLDCEFYKFKLSKELTINVYNYENSVNTVNSYLVETLHFLPYTHQHLSFSLRAPPTLA